MSVIRYFAGVLSIAAIFAVAGCAEKGDGGGYDGPSVATSAKLHFISRLSDDALFASDADADAVGDYIGTAMNGDDVTVAFLDRTDMSGAADAAQILLDTRKWSSFIALGQTGAEDFDVTTFVFNEPAELVTAYQIEQGCYGPSFFLPPQFSGAGHGVQFCHYDGSEVCRPEFHTCRYSQE